MGQGDRFYFDEQQQCVIEQQNVPLSIFVPFSQKFIDCLACFIAGASHKLMQDANQEMGNEDMDFFKMINQPAIDF